MSRPKTKRDHRLALPAVLVPLLRVWWEGQGTPTTGPVFPVPAGLRKQGKTSYAWHLRDALWKAGIVRPLDGFEHAHAAWRAFVEADEARTAEAKSAKKARPWAERRAARSRDRGGRGKGTGLSPNPVGLVRAEAARLSQLQTPVQYRARCERAERAASDGARGAQEHDDAHGLRAARAARRAGDAERCDAHPRSGSAAAVCFGLSLQNSEEVGAPRRIRTYDPRIRSPMLYPAELGARRNAIQVRGARAVK